MNLFLLCRTNKPELKLFKRYIKDVVCIVKRNGLEFLEYANSPHKNLHFIIEIPNGNGNEAFLKITEMMI